MVLQRDNDNMLEIIENSELLKRYKDSFISLNKVKQIDLSASFVREKINKGESIKGLVPEEILKDILEKYK